jgi:hypothetical protein
MCLYQRAVQRCVREDQLLLDGDFFACGSTSPASYLRTLSRSIHSIRSGKSHLIQCRIVFDSRGPLSIIVEQLPDR